MIVKKGKKAPPPPIFDPTPFWDFASFWNFDHLPVNYDTETSKKKSCSYDAHPKPKALNKQSCQVQKRHTWPKFVISVSPVFSSSVGKCDIEGTL